MMFCFSNHFAQNVELDNKKQVEKVKKFLTQKKYSKKEINDSNTLYITGAKKKDIIEKLIKKRTITREILANSKKALLKGDELDRARIKLSKRKIL